MTFLVSIVIPTYNRAHLIGETLDSILAQTYTNWECIIVDDGSTDNTDEVVGAYVQKDARFKYFHRPDTHLPGGNGARNFGFLQSKGEYVNFLDSDDIFHPKKIEIKIQKVIKFDCDVVISKHTYDEKELNLKKDEKFSLLISNNFDIDFILSRNQILIGDPLIKSNFIKNSLFDENLRRGQDHDFFIRLFRNNIKYCLLDFKLYLIKVTPKSITVNSGYGNRTMITTQINIHKKMIDYYINHSQIVFEYQRKTRKMYKSLVLKRKVFRILEHYHFYRNSFKLSNIDFFKYFIINILTKRGFDKMRKNIK